MQAVSNTSTIMNQRFEPPGPPPDHRLASEEQICWAILIDPRLGPVEKLKAYAAWRAAVERRKAASPDAPEH